MHFFDIQILMDLFAELLKKGNTIIVIEHNEDLIKNAQHIIELGPNSGNLGGELIYSGDFEGFEKCGSKTAKAIAKFESESLLYNKMPLNPLKGTFLQSEEKKSPLGDLGAKYYK